MINTIIIIILGIILGFFIGKVISKILIKRHKRKITKNAAEKILKQKTADFQTLEGKPVSLNFKNDGKIVDLKKEVKKQLAKTKIKNIKEFEDKKPISFWANKKSKIKFRRKRRKRK